MVFIESTAEGQAGMFYDMTRRAEAAKLSGKVLSPQNYRYHFFAWWMDPGYRVDPVGVSISPKEHEYFDRIEGEEDCVIDLDQRAWYIVKRDEEFATEPQLMWREYPSTAKECWQSSTEGKYMAAVLAKARREGRICRVPMVKHVPVNSFWDVGGSDTTVVWLHQKIGAMDHWIRYREANGEGFLPFIIWMERQGCVWGKHYLPHDASNAKQLIENVTSTVSQLRMAKPTWDWTIVPRVSSIQHGIDLMRNDFDTYLIDEEECKDGIAHLENYSRKWNTRFQTWDDEPNHKHSDAPDAMRQKAQAFEDTGRKKSKKRAKRATGMTA